MALWWNVLLFTKCPALLRAVQICWRGKDGRLVVSQRWLFLAFSGFFWLFDWEAREIRSRLPMAGSFCNGQRLPIDSKTIAEIENKNLKLKASYFRLKRSSERTGE